MKKFDFDNAVYTYMVSDKIVKKFSHQLFLESKELVVNYTSRTMVLHEVLEENEIAIIGLCVDAYGEIPREKIPDYFLRQSFSSAEEAFTFCDRFAGKYVILYIKENQCFLWGDATCSIPMNYTGSLKEKHFCVSPFDKMTAEYMGILPDENLEKIRKGQDPSQAMPGDLTPYKQIHSLLPNQFLNGKSGEPVRMKFKCSGNIINTKEHVDYSYMLAMNIAEEYGKYNQLICPLTSGYDSRIVYCVLKEKFPEILCFTQKYEEFNADVSDVRVPSVICKIYGQPYRMLEYKETPLQYIGDVVKNAGLSNSVETIKEAYMYMCEFHDEARINGNIAGQIGKSSITNSVPNVLGTSAFFQCKIHNTEKNTWNAMRNYLNDLKLSGDNICDLFALESRCGRWAGQEEALYSLCGMNSLNIFNCRELIREWMSVSRKARVNKEIHKEFIILSDEKLLQFPFNPDEKFEIMKKNWFLFYIATFVKQGLLLAGIHYD